MASKSEDEYKSQRSRISHWISIACITVWILFCRFLLFCTCRLKSVNKDRMYIIARNRARDQPVVTICNHISFLDPPLLAAAIPLRNMFDIDRLVMHTIGAREFLHRNWLVSAWFRSLKCQPCDRGRGLDQPCMTFLRDRLCYGEWVHVFPEGRINKTGERMEYKLGTAKLIAESRVVPLVIPMYYVGTDKVLPTKRPYYPRIGERVTAVYGTPIEFSDEVRTILQDRRTDTDALTRITKELRDHMDIMALQAIELHG